MLKAEDEARIWPLMIPRHLRPPVDFLPIGEDTFPVDKYAQWVRRKIAEAFMIPIDLLPLSTELSSGKAEEYQMRKEYHPSHGDALSLYDGKEY